MRAYNRTGRRGFTLVELMIVVAIIGVLAALAIFGVRRYLASAKTSEAKQTVGAIARAAQLAHERENAGSAVLAEGASSAAAAHTLCTGAAEVPAGGIPAGTKYQPKTTAGDDFNAGDGLAGWKCLGFTMTNPIYYQYDYNNEAPFDSAIAGLAAVTSMEATAQGNLDADLVTSMFARGGTIANGLLVLNTQLLVTEEYE